MDYDYEETQDSPQVSSPVPAQNPIEKQSIAIFIDYSNVTANLEIPGGSHPINPYGLAQFLEGSRLCTEKQISGSFPPPNHGIWKIWKNLDYRTRITESGKELFVDDSLHAQIFRLLLTKDAAKKVGIVLVTGDGNANNNYSSFVECVVRAIELNFKVEICSWKQR